MSTVEFISKVLDPRSNLSDEKLEEGARALSLAHHFSLVLKLGIDPQMIDRNEILSFALTDRLNATDRFLKAARLAVEELS